MKANTITGIPCPSCDHPLTRVMVVARIDQGAVRRRACKKCDHRFYTLQPHEMVLDSYAICWRPTVKTRSVPELRSGWDMLVELFNKDTKARIAREEE